MNYLNKLRNENIQLKQQLAKKEKDRDTWKRACELACKEAPMHCPDPPAEKSREVTCREPTEEDYKTLALAKNLEKHNYLKQIEG